MPTVYIDQSKNLKLVYRQGEGRSFTLTVVDEDANAYDTTGLDFVMEVFNVFDRDVNLFQLTEISGGGILNGGATGIITLDPSDDDVDLDEGFYEWRFKSTADTPNTWFSATFEINNSPQATSVLESNADVTVNLGPINVTVSIILGAGGGGGVERYRGEVSIAGNAFPIVGGTNDMKDGGGRPTRSDWFLTTDGGNLLDRTEAVIEVPANSILFYTGADDGTIALGANWKINQG